VFPKIFLLRKVVRDAKKVEKHWLNGPFRSSKHNLKILKFA